MEFKDWIQLIVPIICNLFFSGFIAVIISKKIEKHYKLEEKKDHYAYIVMGETKKQLESLKMHIIRLQCGMIENDDYRNGLEHFFMTAGDLQIYFEDYENYMKEYEKKVGEDFFLTKDLEKIIKKIIEIGLAMGAISKDEHMATVCADLLNETLNICKEVIKKYNVSLAEA